MSAEIHPTAIVDPAAAIGEDVFIGPFCILSRGVKIGRGTRLISNVIVEGNTEIGERCQIYPFAGIGLAPQDLKYKGEATGVKIGNDNIIREYTTVHRASVGGDGLTEIGDRNFLMAYCHVAHDCKVRNNVVMANVGTLAGHVEVHDYAVIGGLVAVHQFTRIGAYTMVGGCSGVTQDIPPYTMASGQRAELFGLNSIGLKRHGFSDDAINTLKKAYKILFREELALKNAIKRVKEELPATDEVSRLIEFIEQSKRGICR